MVDDTRPIWIQLVDEFRRRVVMGVWASGAKIPSVRDLAVEMGVNPNTVQRALAELDRTGVTTTERTAGRFVTTDAALIEMIRTESATQATDDYLAVLRALGLDRAAVVTLIEQRWTTGG